MFQVNVKLVNKMVTDAYYVPDGEQKMTNAYNVPGHNVALVNIMVTVAYYVPGHNVMLVNRMVADA